MADLIVYLLTAVYGTLILFFYLGIRREARRERYRNDWQPRVSVIVPARNEAASIGATLSGLAAQSYPAARLEVIIVDDRSTDNTAEVVRNFIDSRQLAHFRLIIHDEDGEQPTYKKAAIAHGLKAASGEIIMTTDADCRVQPTWVASMAAHFQEDTGMVCGLITFAAESRQPLFDKIQTLEFAGLVFCGVGAIGNRYPLICNGSNLSYRRAAFEAVGGFDGHAHIASGDDDLFMQNIHHKTDWRIHYNLSSDAINYTRPVKTLRGFMNQRARWASKSTHYPGVGTTLLLLMIYSFYLLLFGGVFLAAGGIISWQAYALAVIVKLGCEFLVLREALGHLGHRRLTALFPLGELLQVPYIVLAGFAGFFKLFKWKTS